MVKSSKKGHLPGKHCKNSYCKYLRWDREIETWDTIQGYYCRHPNFEGGFKYIGRELLTPEWCPLYPPAGEQLNEPDVTGVEPRSST